MNPGALNNGGVGALELVAMDLKARLYNISTNTSTLSHMHLYVSEIYIILLHFLISGGCIYVAHLATRVLSLKLLTHH